MKIGYARVSTTDQNLDRQISKLKEFGCEHIIREKKSGASRDHRVELEKLISKLRFKDVVVVTELSRLARSLQDLLNILNELKGNEVDFVSIKENIDTRESNIYSKFMLQIMGAIAEFERDLTKERQKEGIIEAKKKGIYKGRKVKYHENAKGSDKIIYDAIVNSLRNKESVASIHRKTGVARNTIYKIAKDKKLIY
ncbi:recombinase family protein [Heyndrickxia sporothermodurans]|uniref:Recombinase family protein n=1 Tax=Heyndrickxia sporothermodurans TaxID=46224 RepID=A0AB37HF75_9BACI|nr:recombinase family protein [Heyndrickxia sporothermodurans]MBL5769348.1 recombinase family protein [Heyndrickxia sporothermodurans]MBL5773130.1 recombinase family protein [Heyndrickxia sporothermodurans]MBL5776618.1 recombinase family protein [Heyndrickxia sporothermodurans]MBL5783715.1 recombinase family protein [Heyndrickxia sporothermodurans]MBL5787217.1 recombinase family protein [Heyndrickxia sporothermodurans]